MLPGLPNPHAALVHFPIVLVPVAVVVDVVAMVLRRRGLDVGAAAAWGVAALAASVTWLAGRSAADGLVDVAPQAQVALGAHADAAFWVLVGVWVIAVVRAGTAWLPPDRWWAQVPRAAALLAGVGLGLGLAVTADRGGRLVYNHAVAVTVPACDPCEAAPEPPPPVEGELDLVERDGQWVWTPGPDDLRVLGNEPWPGRGVVLAVDGEETLLLPETFGDVQVNAWLDVTYYDGDAVLLHHQVDGIGGAFEVTTEGGVRLVDGSETLDAGQWEARGRPVLSVSAAGTHFKGLIDGKTVAHGHAAARGPGAVGLRLTGRGVVVVERVEVVPLEGDH